MKTQDANFEEGGAGLLCLLELGLIVKGILKYNSRFFNHFKLKKTFCLKIYIFDLFTCFHHNHLKILKNSFIQLNNIIFEGNHYYQFYVFFLFSILFSSIMSALKIFRRLVCQFDMFCSSELLRYHSETQYKTLTGGLLSLMIISVVIGGFASMVGDTLNRVAITSSLVVKKQSDPPLAVLKPGADSMFMLGLSIQSIDLTRRIDLVNGPQYFYVQMTAIEINAGVPFVKVIQLQQCTQEHWSMMPQFAAVYDNFGVSGWLCLPLGSSLNLQGAYTSSINQEILIQVYPCQNTTSKNNCASQQSIDQIFESHGNFYLALNYINPVINPNEPDFISHYIEANDYIIFSSTIGSEAWIYFSDYTITSDNSILPYESSSTITGCIVEQKAINHPYTYTKANSYTAVFLAKSANSLTYNRQVQKISAVFSYIGGLVGAITAVLFLIKSYTDTSLEVSIGLSLFELSEWQKQEKQKDKADKYFNLLGFIRLTCYRLLKSCGWKGIFEKAQRMQRYQKEAIKQLDVELLLKRVIKLETCMSKLFTPQQLKEIKQGQKITFKSARYMRNLLFKDEQQLDSEEQSQSQQASSKKEEEINDAIKFNPTEEGFQCKQRNQLESSTSIYKLRPNKFGQFLKPSELQIEEAKVVTRKTILKRRKNDQNKQAEDASGAILNYQPPNLQPIII